MKESFYTNYDELLLFLNAEILAKLLVVAFSTVILIVIQGDCLCFCCIQ